MTLTEQVITQARIMACDLPQEQEPMLEAICRASVAALRRRLRGNLMPEDCLTDFVTAAGMFALAAMSEVTDMGQLEQITAGDLTLRSRSCNAASSCLRGQAELLMAPYLESGYLFQGV